MNLTKLLKPKSVAVIGASEKEGFGSREATARSKGLILCGSSTTSISWTAPETENVL